MNDDLKEALQMVEILAAALQLAHHEKQQISTRDVDREIRAAGKLLKKHNFPSDMAAD